ncbi:MAG: hypothetical protein ACT4ON_08080 [Bacteroidota bacterium]
MIDTLLIIVMVVGIFFYSLILLLFFLGKNKKNDAGSTQSIGWGKVNVKASEFIILALVSATFVLAPIFYNFYKEECPPAIVKEIAHEFIIRGQAINDSNKVKSNVKLFATQLRRDSIIVKKPCITDNSGLYMFRFENALPKDQFIISWTEPDQKEKTKTFEFNEISYPIVITFNSN